MAAAAPAVGTAVMRRWDVEAGGAARPGRLRRQSLAGEVRQTMGMRRPASYGGGQCANALRSRSAASASTSVRLQNVKRTNGAPASRWS